MPKIAELTLRMIEFNAGEPGLTHHLLKVHDFSRTIGMLEGLAPDVLMTLEMAALMHDIGIKPCLEKYGTCNGKQQEEEGPQHARPMLEAVGASPAETERVCYLIAHHHTYTDIDGIDYQILVEADFLVNLYEGNQGEDAKRSAYEKLFRTEAGKRIFQEMYGRL